MVKILTLICLLIAFATGPVAAAATEGPIDYTSAISFLGPAEVKLENGLVINFRRPLLSTQSGKKDSPYYTNSTAGLFGKMYSTLMLNGANVTFKNTTKQVMVIRWRESSLSFGNFSGIPFLDGMQYREAGNPSSTPDSVIAPGQTVSRELYVSSVNFYSGPNGGWSMNGSFIPRDNSLMITLVLKVLDANEQSKYFSVVSPPIGGQYMYGFGLLLNEAEHVIDIAYIIDGYSAKAAGVKAGDKIVKINNIPVNSKPLEEMHQMIISGGAEASLNLTVLRDNKELAFKITKQCGAQ